MIICAVDDEIIEEGSEELVGLGFDDDLAEDVANPTTTLEDSARVFFVLWVIFDAIVRTCMAPVVIARTAIDLRISRNRLRSIRSISCL